jgi:hypothetical protein
VNVFIAVLITAAVRDVTADAGFQCDKTAVVGAAVKETVCIYDILRCWLKIQALWELMLRLWDSTCVVSNDRMLSPLVIELKAVRSYTHRIIRGLFPQG